MKQACCVALLGILLASGSQLVGQAGKDAAKGVVVDKEKKTVTIDAKMAPRKLPNLDQIYPLEVIACWPHPKGEEGA